MPVRFVRCAMAAMKAGATNGGARRSSAGGRRAGNARADAQRNRGGILQATVDALRKDPDASVAQIAAEAGVGRMTLYGHFRTRPELLEAALVDRLDRGETVLQAVDLDGDARQAF